jgi:allantoicase|tara:strand:- start:209 stop:358 length:150 start_codon:yes stop_codon:yes gene_type:complete
MFKFVITAIMENGDAWETIRHTKEGLDIVIQDILKDDTVIAFDVEEVLI